MTTRFGQDARVAGLSYRAWALWLLGYPEAARRDTERALQDALRSARPPRACTL